MLLIAIDGLLEQNLARRRRLTRSANRPRRRCRFLQSKSLPTFRPSAAGGNVILDDRLPPVVSACRGRVHRARRSAAAHRRVAATQKHADLHLLVRARLPRRCRAAHRLSFTARQAPPSDRPPTAIFEFPVFALSRRPRAAMTTALGGGGIRPIEDTLNQCSCTAFVPASRAGDFAARGACRRIYLTFSFISILLSMRLAGPRTLCLHEACRRPAVDRRPRRHFFKTFRVWNPSP